MNDHTKWKVFKRDGTWYASDAHEYNVYPFFGIFALDSAFRFAELQASAEHWRVS